MLEIVNSLWIGRPLSVLEQLSISSFLQNGHAYHLYGYDKIANVPAGTVLRDAAEILPASEIFYCQCKAGKGSVAAFADLFRYKLLLEKGGWWVDTDMVCLRPFDFTQPIVFAGERNNNGTQVATAAIKLPQGHSVAGLCYGAAAQADRAKMTWGKIGPFLLDRIVREKGLQQFIKAPDVFCPVNYWDWQSLILENSNPPKTPATKESHAIHLWHEMWRRAGIKLDAKTGRIQPGRFKAIQWKLGLKQKPEPEGATPFVELLRRFGLVGNPQTTPVPSGRG
jgi:hypothetical protein